MLRLALVALVLAGCNGRFDFGVAPDAGTCTELTACPAPLQCEREQHLCVECLGDGDCSAAAKACDLTLHRCVDCVRDSQCGYRQLCEPKTRRCVPRCEYVEDCPDGYRFCELGQCRRCDWDPHCQASTAPVCDLDVGVCAECTADRDCKGELPRCDRTTGKCVGCTTSSECTEAAPICNPSLHRCVGL